LALSFDIPSETRQHVFSFFFNLPPCRREFEYMLSHVLVSLAGHVADEKQSPVFFLKAFLCS
jgi:hypothetical protein